MMERRRRRRRRRRRTNFGKSWYPVYPVPSIRTLFDYIHNAPAYVYLRSPRWFELPSSQAF
jgi:hypothetical protein